ncbi:3-deoxy-7-phosphoheptulonate synthase [Vibrio cidicii]|uniref:3-deoxy-7-phosphoheptulonate synthase n=1 Tax=Vibrio cidicii TaxID=1763883 RepID=UPI0018C1D929|nr:3-deoxy-7-phosphoheptulonate synthase [Vibrio cidicii]MBG0757044.1 3-deoxy-7-phosphoheptulonate synthase [Vibrio cidicii]
MSHLTHAFQSESILPLPTFESIAQEFPLDWRTRQFIHRSREAITQILSGQDDRLVVIIGPCSIHDPQAGLHYARQLAALQERYRSQLLIVMRTYFEKPRTRGGWKGLLVDPKLDGTHDLPQGIRTARHFLQQVSELGLATATEFLDVNLAPYIADLICWGAIGARTAESQPHRQLASALACPIGFKNGTDGNINIAIDAIHAARDSHILPLAGSEQGALALRTSGNPYGHIILRGGKTPNYNSEHVVAASNQLMASDLPTKLIIDCSHGNSGKKALNQLKVADAIAEQLCDGETCIAGVMCESFLLGEKQALGEKPLVYGQSITDECLSWQDSQRFLDTVACAVAKVQQANAKLSTVA